MRWIQCWKKLKAALARRNSPPFDQRSSVRYDDGNGRFGSGQREGSSLTSGRPCRIPLFLEPVAAGFPSPAGDYIEQSLDLNEHLIQNKASTFIVKAEGDSMREAGIHSGDMLVVDKSLEARDGDIGIVEVDGLFMVKRYWQSGGTLRLVAENAKYPPVKIHADSHVVVWGVVMHVIHSPRQSR
jgi:DNA polymerase V